MAATRRDFSRNDVKSLRFGGAVAQLGERLVRNEEVRGSNPLGSTIQPLRGHFFRQEKFSTRSGGPRTRPFSLRRRGLRRTHRPNAIAVSQKRSGAGHDHVAVGESFANFSLS
jgi:hypothetical protein